MGLHTRTVARQDGNQGPVSRSFPLDVDWSQYVGIPFVEGGDDQRGCDCWGLVRLIYRQEAGIHLDTYSDISPTDLRNIARAMRDGSTFDPLWRAVRREDVEAGDVCLMSVQSSSLVAHAGLMVDSDRVLHVEQSTASVIVPIDHHLYRHRVVSHSRLADG